MHRNSHPRSPVQSVGGTSLWPFLLLIATGAGYAGWERRDEIVDWYDGDTPALASGPQAAQAELYRIFSTDDYPMEAIRREEQGTVAFRVSIGRRGNVTDCVVTSSSGSQALDRATCQIVKDRGKYRPARDSEGKRVPAQDTGRIRWMLPDQ